MEELHLKKYSAGAVSHSFWFGEFQYSSEEAKHLIVDKNYWKKPSENVAKRTYVTVNNRVHSLSKGLAELFDSVDVENRRVINLVAIMNTMKLMRDFMYQVYRPQLIIGDSKIEDYEITSYFRNLESAHEEVAKWTDQTRKRLQRAIKTFLREAHLATDEGTALLIRRPLLDPRLENQLIKDGHADYVAILLGK
jgi:hypothetical protein